MEISEDDKKLIDACPPRVIEIITELQTTIISLSDRVRDLENRLNLNSTNSSIPSSKNPLHARKKVYNQREKTGRPKGGQPGHKGVNLELKENPDEIIECKPEKCLNCGTTLPNENSEIVDKRQVVDIPVIPIQYTEYQIFASTCPNCNIVNKGEAPEHVTQKIQYGPRLTAFVVYLSVFQLLPYGRLTECLKDLFGCSISPGTVDNMIQRVSSNLESFIVTVKFLLICSLVAHFDETGTQVGKLRRWLHVACTPLLTLYGIFTTRGKAAMDKFGILPNFFGTAVHDFWGSYPNYPCKHAYCNSHIIRDLTRVEDETSQQWAVALRSHLVRMKEVAESYHENGLLVPLDQLENMISTFLQLVAEGFDANPPLEPTKKSQGKVKQYHAYNLLLRLRDHQDGILRFFHDPLVPFDNNQAERDIRMPKLKTKISGPFGSDFGACAFVRIRSYISTLRKNHISIIDGLISATLSDPWLPEQRMISVQEVINARDLPQQACV